MTLIKDFLGLSRAVNRDPLIQQTAQNPKFCLSKASFKPQDSSVPGKKQAGKEETKVSCQFFINVIVLAVCKELPCFPSNFVCAQMRLVHFFPLLFSDRLFVPWTISNVFFQLHGPFIKRIKRLTCVGREVR